MGRLMTIETIYRTPDGEIFDTKKEAQEYLAEEKRLSDLLQYCRESFVAASDASVRDVLIVLSEGYDIVKRKK